MAAEEPTVPTSVYEAEAPDSLGGHDLTDVEKEGYVRMFLSYDDTVAANLNDFPMEGDDLLDLAKVSFLKLWVSKDFTILSDGFKYQGASLGPLSRHEFIEALTKYDFEVAFPGCTYAVHNAWIDVHRPSRVYIVHSFEGKHTGQFDNIKATKKSVTSPPQIASLEFDAEGKVIKATGGYVIDRDVGNTGGLGAILGMLWAIGKPLPIPEGHPHQPSWQLKVATFVDGIAKNFGKKNNKKAIKSAPQKTEEEAAAEGGEVAEEEAAEE